MRKKPHLLDQVSPWDIALYREVCYETARKEYKVILEFFERPVRFLTFRDLICYYDPAAENEESFWERYFYLKDRS